MAGRCLRGLAGREEGFQLTPQAQDLTFGIRQVPAGGGLEGEHEAVDGVAGGAHHGSTVPLRRHGQSRGEKAQPILEAGLGLTWGTGTGHASSRPHSGAMPL